MRTTWVCTVVVLYSSLLLGETQSSVSPSPNPAAQKTSQSVSATVAPQVSSSPNPMPKEFLKDEKHPFFECDRFMANPPGVQGFVTRDGKRFFFLLSKGLVERAQNSSGSQWSWQLTEIDLTTHKAKAILSLLHGRDAILVPAGEDKITGVSILSFESSRPECFWGKALLSHLSLIATARRAVNSNGYFTTVEGLFEPLLVNLVERSVFMVDMGQFQSRIVAEVNPEERPLYFDSKQAKFVVLKKDAKSIRLIRRTRNEKVDFDIEVKSGEKVLLNASRIAILKIGSKNALHVQLCPDLYYKQGEDMKKCRVFKIDIPEETPLAEARYRMSSQTERVVIYGSEPLTARRWQRAYVVDLSQGRIVDTLRSGGPYYVYNPTFYMNGNRVIFEVRRVEDHRTQSLLIYDANEKKAREIPFVKDRKKSKGRT